MRRLGIRRRLTLWYGAVLAAVLALFGGAVYALMRHELLARIDAAVAGELAEVREEVEASGDRAELRRRLVRRFSRHEGFEFEVTTPGGEALFRSDRIGRAGVGLSQAGLGATGKPAYRSVALGRLGRWRVAGRVAPGPGGPMVIRAASSLASLDHELAELLAVLLVTGPLALLGALGGGYGLARTALAPVDRMAATAEAITATSLDRRIDVPNPDDELGRLARTLNGMIARLERSFGEIRRFTADAAHELRTPLTVLRNAAEVALRSPREPEQYRRVLEDQLEEVERLTRLAEQLLFLCRGDAGLVPMGRRPLRLDGLIRDVAEHMRAVAEERGLALVVEIGGACPIVGDEDQLRRLLFNLLDNALKYTPPGGSVSVRGECPDGRACLVVADTGVGIPPEHLPRIFDRFYRIDPARSREAGGTGLGLAICRSIAEAHGGQIHVESVVGRGTEVILTLPISKESPR